MSLPTIPSFLAAVMAVVLSPADVLSTIYLSLHGAACFKHVAKLFKTFGGKSLLCTAPPEGFQKEQASGVIQLVNVAKHVLQSVKLRVRAGSVSQP